MEKQFKPLPDDECLKYHGTPDNPDIKIFVSHRIDLDSETIDNPLYIPVRCGAVYDERENVTMLGDDTGENISEKRNSFCELTVLYWAWKNIKADYYGLCHYRRYLSFAEEKHEEDKWGHIVKPFITKESNKIYGLENKELMTDIISKNDLIIPSAWNVKRGDYKNLWEQWEKNPPLQIEDLKKAQKIIDEYFPEYSEFFDKYMNEKIFYPCCMFIASKEIFNQMCEFIFGVIFKLENEIDTTNYSEEGLRSIAHIAERLFGVFYGHLKKKNPKLKIEEAQRVLFWNTEKFEYPKPIFEKKAIPIVLSCSDYFSVYVAVVIKSIVENSSSGNNYDLIFLCTDLSKKSKQMLLEIIEPYNNFSLRFFNIERFVSRYKLESFLHVSKETFYRLICPNLLNAYDKILYLDSDLIIKHDVAELYNTELGDCYIAATHDHDYIGEYNQDLNDIKKYTKEKLKLKEPYQYFQAGVVLFNIKKINEDFEKDELIKMACEYKYRFGDQCIMNSRFQGKVKFVDSRWNVLIDCLNYRMNEIIKKGPKWSYDVYMESRKDPWIIHYAGGEKPWNTIECDFSEEYWKYARMTPFVYELNLKRMIENISCFYDNRMCSYVLSTTKRKLRIFVYLKSLIKKIMFHLPFGKNVWNGMRKIFRHH